MAPQGWLNTEGWLKTFNEGLADECGMFRT